MDLINEAKRLHDFGFALLWLYPKSKRPIGDDWQKGDRKSWQELKKTFNRANNLGVRLGSASKFPDDTFLCVLDCDVKSSDPHHLKEMEKALMAFCPAHEFAPRVLSGRGGGSCHFYFRTRFPQQSFKAIRSGHKVKVFMPSAPASKADEEGLTTEEINAGYRMRLAWEVDVFGDGKQVVLPPSIHPDTLRAYEWEYILRDHESIPLHENFMPKKVRLTKETTTDLDLQDVDLFSTPISSKHFDLISSGKGFEAYPSRSEALFASLNALVYANLTDGQIRSVLTDPTNFMSEKPLEAGKGDKYLASRWLQKQIDKIREERRDASAFTDVAVVQDIDDILGGLTEEEAQAQVDELIPWQDKLERSRTGYKNTAYNLYLILKNISTTAPLEVGLFAYDLFNQALVYQGVPPWGSEDDFGRELTDLDDGLIQTWLSKEWGIECAEQRICTITLQLGHENSFHPVRRYLNSLKWDGKERLDSMLIRYCGAVGDTRYLSDVGRKVMCGAVARVMNPGVKMDYMMILEGAQGIRKSTFVHTLAGQWYSDSLGDISNKDVVDNMRGKWIVEIGELASMNRSETNEMKAFTSRQSDVARKAYGRRAQTYPRQCIFVGTTNNDEYLKDETGGRRYWPVATTKYDIDAAERDRDQLWAEAYVTYQLGEPLYLEDETVRKFAEEEQGCRYIVDEMLTKIKGIIEDDEFPQRFTFDDLWARIAMDETGRTKSADYPMQLRLKKILRVLKYPKIRVRPEPGASGAYYWLKKNPKGVIDPGYWNKTY